MSGWVFEDVISCFFSINGLAAKKCNINDLFVTPYNNTTLYLELGQSIAGSRTLSINRIRSISKAMCYPLSKGQQIFMHMLLFYILL